jgi:hypothetical protein
LRTSVVLAGVAMLVLGVVLVAFVVVGALASITSYSTFTQSGQGEYVSREMALNASSVVVVVSPASPGGLIPAQDLSTVNSTNVGSLAASITRTVANTDTYRSLNGSYYYVAFSSTLPVTKIDVTATHSGVFKLGALALVGVVLFVAGIIVAIIGAVLKGRPKETYELKQ